jgi:low affinity Fe/Cu permease
LALQIKLDEIIRATGAAQNGMINLEELSQQELEDMKQKFAKIDKRARKKRQKNQLLFTAPLKDNS